MGHNVYIDDSAVLIGDVTMGDAVSCWLTAITHGDVSAIEIGSRTNIQDGCLIHRAHKGRYTPEGFPALIGSSVTLGHHAVIHGCSIGNYKL